MKRAQCSETVKSRVPSIWFVWKIWDFLVTRGQKLGARGHRALLEHTPAFEYMILVKNQWNKKGELTYLSIWNHINITNGINKTVRHAKTEKWKKGNITITKEIGTCNHFMMIVRGFWRENSSAQIDRILQSNRENHEHQKIFLEYIVMQKIRPIRHEKLNLQPRTYILIHCGFVASSCVLIFAVIGCNTINILEIFQVFMVLPVW